MRSVWKRGVKPHQAAAAACGSQRARAPTPPAAAGAIRTAFEFFSQRAATGFAVPEWAPTPGNAAYAAAVRRLDRAVYGVIDRRAAELAAAPGPPQARPAPSGRRQCHVQPVQARGGGG